ncbi:MAG: cellulase family glycosylhydrolase, partial [Victivallales bacterium]|nr:cellulase family glycosylhydrolase [Victivallales bacterium]
MDMAIFEDGSRFFVGCNYWASHAGTNMWRDWSAESVEADFKALSENGVQVLRVFPRWDDFQPLTPHLGGGSSFVELRMGENPLPDTEFGRAGVDETMMERFRVFLNLAEKYNLKLLVGIITGWMSGRMLKPQAFERVNVLADPFAIRWEVRFTRLFVKTFKDSKAIVGWDLGNECNCMAGSDIHQFWAWTNAIAGAIRLEDPTRPVVSGMHGLKTDPMQHVPIVDQAELTDVLCTHPYPVFTPHSKVDRVNTIRNAFHAAAETRLYEEIGGKPAFVEEAGSLGPGASSETVAAHYLENMLWN